MNIAVYRKSGAEAGMTLVETMVAAMVLAVALLGLLSTITSTMVADAITRENNIALDLGRYVMEQYASLPPITLSSIADGTLHLDMTDSTLTNPPGFALEGVTLRPNVPVTTPPSADIEVQLQPSGKPAIQGIETVDPTRRAVSGNDGRVIGTVTVSKARVDNLTPANPSDDGTLHDVFEITVVISWRGTRGQRSSQTFFCRVTDWGV